MWAGEISSEPCDLALAEKCDADAVAPLGRSYSRLESNKQEEMVTLLEDEERITLLGGLPYILLGGLPDEKGYLIRKERATLLGSSEPCDLALPEKAEKCDADADARLWRSFGYLIRIKKKKRIKKKRG